MEIPPWYVLTGGPSSGKTTLAKELKRLGYHTTREVARDLINEYLRKGIEVKELRKDESLFQQIVLQRKIEKEKRIPKDGIVFFDRGIPETIAYFKVCGLDTQEVEKISRNRYRKIFFLEQLPFKQDYARTEDEATIRRLNQLILDCYENLGYEVVHIPDVSIEERLQIVLSHL